MKTNIVLVGMIYEKTKEIAEKLSDEFDLYYANVEDIISYSLFNEDDIKKKCGKTYLNKLKKSILKDIGNFENSLICVDNSMFLEKDNVEILNAYSTIVFLDFSKKILQKMIKNASDNDKKSLKVIELTFEEKRNLCIDKSDVVIEIKKDNFDKNYKTVKKVLESYFL